jgi:DNA-directed RNA polymerase specialized sigma24 family protein
MAGADWFAALYRAEYRRVVLTCFAVTGDLVAAQEVARETFVLAYGWRARLGDGEHAGDWLRSVAVERARRRALRARLLHRTRVAREPDTDLGILPEEQRIVLLLHEVAELDTGEIGLLLGVSEETVTDRVAAARAALGDHTDLNAVRERLNRAVIEPDMAAMIARHRTRVGRRRRLAAVAAVVVIGAAIPLLRTALRPVPDAKPVVAEPVPSAEPTTRFVYGVDVNIGQRVQGYALRAVCPARSQTKPCTTEILYTEDGGFWAIQSRLPAPVNANETWLDRRIQTLGPRRVMVESRSERWYSGDSALTWQWVPMEPDTSVAAIPTDAVLESRCFVVTSRCRGVDQLRVVLPDSGRSATLTTAPSLDQLVPGRLPAADGGWWVSGQDPATGRWSLAVSRDAGQTWSITPLPPFTGTPEAGIAVTAAPHTLYAIAVGRLPDTAAGLLAIFRSTDGGRSWITAWQSGAGSQPHSIAGVARTAPDDSLTITTFDGDTYTSTDGATSFHFLPGPTRYAQWARVGYLASFGGTSGNYSWSRDGSRWFDFTVG